MCVCVRVRVCVCVCVCVRVRVRECVCVCVHVCMLAYACVSPKNFFHWTVTIDHSIKLYLTLVDN